MECDLLSLFLLYIVSFHVATVSLNVNVIHLARRHFSVRKSWHQNWLHCCIGKLFPPGKEKKVDCILRAIATFSSVNKGWMHETKLPVTADTLVMKLSRWQQTAELVMISDIQSVNGAACETINYKYLYAPLEKHCIFWANKFCIFIHFT